MAGTKGRSGRKKKPVGAKKKAGTYRKDRDSESIEVAAGEILDPPANLHPDAIKEWKRLAPICMKNGLLTEADWIAWRAGFMAWSTVLNAWESLADPNSWEMLTGEDGNYRQAVPTVSIFKSAWTSTVSFCREFGLTPSARNGLNIDTGQKIPSDPMSEFLNR